MECWAWKPKESALISCTRLTIIVYCWAWKVKEITFISCSRFNIFVWCWAWHYFEILSEDKLSIVILDMKTQQNYPSYYAQGWRFLFNVGHENSRKLFSSLAQDLKMLCDAAHEIALKSYQRMNEYFVILYIYDCRIFVLRKIVFPLKSVWFGAKLPK